MRGMPTPKPASGSQFIKIQAHIPADVFDRLTAEAEAAERTMSQQVRLALKEWAGVDAAETKGGKP